MCVYIGKIFISRAFDPEKFKFTRKLPDIVQIQVYSNHGPQGIGWGHNRGNHI
jgi:hypothetical protein